MKTSLHQHETISSVYVVRTPYDGILDEAIFLTRQDAEEYGHRQSELDPFLFDPEVVEIEVQGS